MSVAVVVQTCDRYQKYWGGFLHFMERQWDDSIKANIYICNEEVDIQLPDWCRQIKTGRGTFVSNLKKSVESLNEEHVFLMLEDFWPISPIKRRMFDALYEEFKSGGWDALQVSNYTPYYSLKKSERTVLGSNLLEFEPESPWLFNLQARFWRPDALISSLVEPELSETEVSSAITVEMSSDEFARKNLNLKAALYHYLWYPLSGVAYRGEMTDFGSQLQNIVELDRHVAGLFN